MALSKKPKTNKSEEDEAFKKLLDDFIKDFDAEEVKSEEELEFGDLDDDDEGVEIGDYTLYCDVNDSTKEFPVEGMIPFIVPAEGRYVHIDIEL